MNIKDFTSIYFKEKVKIKESGLGLNNQNYYVTTSTASYMVRIPHPLHSIKNHKNESLALEITKHCSFSLNPIYYNETTGILITPLLNDVQTYKDCNLDNKIELVAKALKELHSLPNKVNETFDPIFMYQSFKEKVTQPLFPTIDYEYLLFDLPKTNTLCLCHNDVVDGNLLFSEKQLYLIDFEYANNNDPLFDIMSFFSENQIMDPQLRERFYQVYFDTTNVPYQDLNKWEQYQNLLWCTWAMMMWELHHKEIYKEIATWKFKYLSQSNFVSI